METCGAAAVANRGGNRRCRAGQRHGDRDPIRRLKCNAARKVLGRIERSSEGSTAAIDEVFGRRAADLQELTALVEQLRAVQGSGQTGMKKLLDDLSRPGESNSSPRGGLKTDLARALNNAGDAEGQIQQLIKIYERLRAAAQRHSRLEGGLPDSLWTVFLRGGMVCVCL